MTRGSFEEEAGAEEPSAALAELSALRLFERFGVVLVSSLESSLSFFLREDGADFVSSPSLFFLRDDVLLLAASVAFLDLVAAVEDGTDVLSALDDDGGMM